ncbi:putative transport protein [Escherichia coli]|uniref:Putative transport protein n=1 Tax=Escherichia coli TaxID=562 RepID=A0A376L2H9_ECOLX|nr:putative transport protein [Escherichia coli]
MGSTPNAAAAAASWPPHPAAQGIVQMIGIFIDTLVICTASAMLILLAGNGTTYMPLEGIQLIQKAMRVLMGSWGAGVCYPRGYSVCLQLHRCQLHLCRKQSLLFTP